MECTRENINNLIKEVVCLFSNSSIKSGLMKSIVTRKKEDKLQFLQYPGQINGNMEPHKT
jgi:hypothetical protein